MNGNTQTPETPEPQSIPPDLPKGSINKNRIATVIGFLGGGVFFLLSIITDGAVPGGGRGGALGFISGYALARFVLAFVP